MEESILDSIKKLLGISPEDTSFDVDVVMYINGAFAVLQQLGVGPDEGYIIEDSSDEWVDYLDDENAYNMIRPWMVMRVRLSFDPPPTSFGIDALKEQAKELEYRISAHREWKKDPVDPMAVVVEEELEDDD